MPLKVLITLIISGACLESCSVAPKRPVRFGEKSGGEVDSGGIGDDDVSEDGTPVKLVCDPNAELDPGSVPLRRMSRAQYKNSVRDLIGSLPVLDTVLGNQTAVMSLGTSLSIASTAEIAAYSDAALSISAAFVANKTLLQKVVNCTGGADVRGCTSTAVGKLASKAFRTPATPEDITKLMSLYDLGVAVSHEHGIELVLSTILQSPRFLYQVEVGTDEKLGSKAVKLNDYEVASRLAFALWDSAPDDNLLAAAAAGKLRTAAGVNEQITLMLADPKGKTLLRRFLETWTRVDDFAAKEKDTAIYPEWTPALKLGIRTQATAFFDNILSAEGGTLAALLGSKSVMMNKDMATIYGVPSTETTFKAVQKNDVYTSGLLSLPAILTFNAGPGRSSPTNRGKFVREALLCQHIGAAPADAVTTISAANPLPTRDAIQQTTASPKCAGCHKLMDPIGFAFEHYDAIGRFRTTEKGVKIDAAGEIFSLPGLEGKFSSLAELGEKLSKSAEVEDCVSKQLFRFIQARLEQPADACAIEKSTAAFKASGAKLNGLPAAILGTESILYRQPIN